LLSDKMSMSQSLECRVPLLDERLIKLASTIPADLRIRGGTTRYILKKALRGVLPNEILDRKKRGFGAPMGAWFKSELKSLRNAVLSRQTIESRGLLSWEKIREVMALHDANREDYTDLLIVLVNLEIWCRLFLDGRGADDVSAELRELTLAA